jgi:pyrimidine operon attenuation protein/uracil phosphoribosyltransferase
MPSKVLLDGVHLDTLLHRLAWQLIEKHKDFSNTILIGLQPRGVELLERLIRRIQSQKDLPNLTFGKLDTTFFRDDFRRSEKIHAASASEMNVNIEGKSVVLIDDVLYTGRSIRAALTAVDSYGRPKNIELLVLIDRRFSRHLPIQPDYVGAQIDVLQGDKVRVKWEPETQKSIVYLEKENA